MIKNIVYNGAVMPGSNLFGPGNAVPLDVRFNASRMIVTKITTISNIKVDTAEDGDPVAAFAIYMSNSVDPIGEIIVDSEYISDGAGSLF